MATERVKSFNQALRKIAVPRLAHNGFKFDGNRTFRRLSIDEHSCEIINFQHGQRSLEGEFTVNLGVFMQGDSPEITPSQANEYDCDMGRRTRIGKLVSYKYPRLHKIPLLGFLFRPIDKWWAFSAVASLTESSLIHSVDLITAFGLSWFEKQAKDSL